MRQSVVQSSAGVFVIQSLTFLAIVKHKRDQRCFFAIPPIERDLGSWWSVSSDIWCFAKSDVS